MGKLVYDTEQIDDIALDYRKGASYISGIIDVIKIFNSNFCYAYDGMAMGEIMPATINKIIEHLEFLMMCYNNAGNYVINSKENMIKLDEICGETMKNLDGGKGIGNNSKIK